MRYTSDDEIGNLALTLVQSVAAIYQEEPQWTGVSVDDIPLVNVRFYEEATEELRGANFRSLGYAENAASSRRTMYSRAIVRFLVSGDGRTLAAVSYTRPPTGWTNGRLDVSLVTETQEGDVLVTSNGKGRVDRVRPAGVKLVETGDAPLKRLAERHEARARYAARRERGRGGEGWTYHRLVDAIGAMQRLHERVAEYRRGIGWVEEKEVVGMFRDRLPEEVMGRLVAAVREIGRKKEKEERRELVEV